MLTQTEKSQREHMYMMSIEAALGKNAKTGDTAKKVMREQEKRRIGYMEDRGVDGR